MSKKFFISFSFVCSVFQIWFCLKKTVKKQSCPNNYVYYDMTYIKKNFPFFPQINFFFAKLKSVLNCSNVYTEKNKKVCTRGVTSTCKVSFSMAIRAKATKLGECLGKFLKFFRKYDAVLGGKTISAAYICVFVRNILTLG